MLIIEGTGLLSVLFLCKSRIKGLLSNAMLDLVNTQHITNKGHKNASQKSRYRLLTDHAIGSVSLDQAGISVEAVRLTKAQHITEN